jgi:hypothetical protein
MLNMMIIGSGIAAECFKFSLIESGLSNNIDLTQISAQGQINSPSFNTTGVIALRNTQRGMSELGDLIVDSYTKFVDFFDQYNFKGITPADYFHLSKMESLASEKLRRRYSDLTQISKFFEKELGQEFLLHKEMSYIVEPKEFISNLASNEKFNKYNLINAIVSKVNTKDLVSSNGNFDFDVLIDCSGAHMLEYSHIDEFKELILKPAHGSYLLGMKNLGGRSFNLTLDDMNLTYRSNSHEILIGSSSDKKTFSGVDFFKLSQMYEAFKDELKIDLPELSHFDCKEAIRAKGRKMMPIACKVSNNIYAVNNLYKNGFTYPFKLSFDLIAIMKSDDIF